MKKSISILLIFIYSIFSAGILMHYHFCGGEISSSSILLKADKPCGCDEDAEMDGCCEDLSVLYKIKEDQQHKVVSFSTFDFFKVITLPFVPKCNYLTTNFSKYSLTFLTHPPPLLGIKTPLLVLFCKWII